jgi:hypothetical protein
MGEGVRYGVVVGNGFLLSVRSSSHIPHVEGTKDKVYHKAYGTSQEQDELVRSEDKAIP